MNYESQLKMIQDKAFFNVNDICEFLQIGKNKSYEIMREIKKNYPGFGMNHSAIRNDVFLKHIKYDVEWVAKTVSLLRTDATTH